MLRDALRRAGVLAAIAAIAAAPAPVRPEPDLRPPTVAAFDRYIRVTEAGMDAELSRGRFLLVDEWDRARRARDLAALARGEPVVERVETRDGGRTIDVPHGMIHHWRGFLFLRGVPLARVLELSQSYDRYAEIFPATIVRSALVSREGDTFRVRQRLMMKKVLTGVANVDSEVVYTTLDDRRVHLRSHSTRVAEVADAGERTEREHPVGQGPGYLWRANAYWFIEARDGGTYLRCEWITLSRDIPLGLGFIIAPIINGFSRDSAEATLVAVRRWLPAS